LKSLVAAAGTLQQRCTDVTGPDNPELATIRLVG
jgi:hypothetical protein